MTVLDKTKLKIKVKAIQKEKEQMEEYIDQLHSEKSDLKTELGRLKYEKEFLKSQYESLKESFGAFKESQSEKEDPFVLRLALNQSRKDFSNLTQKVRFFPKTQICKNSKLFRVFQYNQLLEEQRLTQILSKEKEE